ncbi:alpha/beta hydrolase [Pseudomonas mendocina]|nr:alpha/beta hydrolase [Pseudomonas mendocina]MBH3340137.1 alpha/beta hydrolase [Pseudomonas mendocina]
MNTTRWLYPLMTLLFALTMAGCAAPAKQRLDAQLSARHQLLVLDSRPFPLLAAVLRSPKASTSLRIYIEGDGHAWITPSQPSLDPTPTSEWFALLALSDPHPAAWLARPCQYVRNENCHIGLWTGARFSPEAAAALDQALDMLKQRYRSEQLELIGYSGGAALALLLAARRDDVSAVQSLAGNLSPRLWAAQQRLSPLHGSLEPLDYRQRLQRLPQRHLVGMQDRNVPANLAERWQQYLGDSPCIEIEQLAGLDHYNGWTDAWRARRGMTPSCNSH